MGHICADIEIIGRGSKVRLKNVMVDTGATYTIVEPELARKLAGDTPPMKFQVELGDGRRVTASASTFRVKLLGRKGGATVLTFRRACNLIGVEVLEALGLRVDPKRRRIVAMRATGMPVCYSIGAPLATA